jgi:hypothetical protein
MRGCASIDLAECYDNPKSAKRYKEDCTQVEHAPQTAFLLQNTSLSIAG